MCLSHINYQIAIFSNVQLANCNFLKSSLANCHKKSSKIINKIQFFLSKFNTKLDEAKNVQLYIKSVRNLLKQNLAMFVLAKLS